MGVAAGVAIGVLLAPDKGEETRRKLLGKAKDLADGFGDKMKDGMDKLKHKMNEAEDAVEDGIGQGKQYIKGKIEGSTAKNIQHS